MDFAQLLFIGIWLILALGIAIFLTYNLRANKVESSWKQQLAKLIRYFTSRLKWTGLLVIFAYGACLAWLYVPKILGNTASFFLDNRFLWVLNLFLATSITGFCFSLIHVFKEQLCDWAFQKDKNFIRIILKPVSNSLKTIVLLLILNSFLPLMDISSTQWDWVSKTVTILFINVMAWIAWQWINAAESLVLRHCAINRQDIQGRFKKLRTQVAIFKRIVLLLIFIFALAGVVMTFEKGREFGITLLTSATVMTAALAFAGRPHFGAMVTGFQLAVIQPIQINDTVFVAGEYGCVEEINLNHVVLRTREQRQLWVPTRYFLENIFQNLSRNSDNFIGAIVLYLDPMAPLEKIREKFHALLQESTAWDHKLGKFQLMDIQERVIELRCTISADSLANLGELSCEIREKLLNYIQKYFPHHLPKLRIDQVSSQDNVEN